MVVNLQLREGGVCVCGRVNAFRWSLSGMLDGFEGLRLGKAFLLPLH